MSADSLKKLKEDRQFQIDLSKIQMKNDAVSSQVTSILSIEFSTFVAIAVVYLTYGLTIQDARPIVFGASILVVLFLVSKGTIWYFNRKEVLKKIDTSIEEMYKQIQDKYVNSIPDTDNSKQIAVSKY